MKGIQPWRVAAVLVAASLLIVAWIAAASWVPGQPTCAGAQYDYAGTGTGSRSPQAAAEEWRHVTALDQRPNSDRWLEVRTERATRMVNGQWHLLLVNTGNGGWQVAQVTCAQVD
jgi:hypothetical protein